MYFPKGAVTRAVERTGYKTVYHSKQWNIEIKLFSIIFKRGIYFTVEEVSMKWMDRPNVTAMERGGVYEMEIAILLYPFL